MKQRYDHFTNNTNFFDGRYYIINKKFLWLIGQWPYQPRKERYIRTVLILILTLTFLIAQIRMLFQTRDDIDLFVECFSPLITNIGCSFKLINLLYYSKQLRTLLDSARENWEYMQSYTAELKILQESGEKGRVVTLCYATFINGIAAAYVAMTLSPIVLDYVIPLNESRPHFVLFQADHYFDPDKYSYLIFLHGCIGGWTSIHALVSHDTLYMAVALHACGLIKILRYRLENITKESMEIHATLKLNHRNHQEDVHYQRIVYWIKEHRRVVEFLRIMKSTSEWILFVAVFLTVLLISCTGARTVAKGTAPQDVIRFGFYTVGQVIHLFCISLSGHWIMCSSSLIRESVYNSEWYLMSLKSRKLLIFIIRRCMEPYVLTAGTIYVMSMENFCSILQTSMSYLTMLTSMQ